MATRQATPNILDDLMSSQPAGVVKPAATALRIAEIRRDGGTQPRAGLDEAHVVDLVAAIAAGDELPPVDVVFDGTAYWLYDGYHRTEAASRSGKYTVQAIIHQGTQADAQWLSYGVNRGHGLKRTNEDKKRAVLAALRHPKGAILSDRELSQHVGVDHKTIGAYRGELSVSGEIPQIAERTVTRGGTTYTQNTAKIGTNQPPRPRPQRDDAAEDAWTAKQEAPAAKTELWQLEWAASQAIREFYRDATEMRTAWSDMRASARIMNGGFWLAAMKVCDNHRFLFAPADLAKAINNVANQREQQEQVSEAARQAKAGRPLVEVIKTDDELAAEAQAADIASRNAAADEAARQAQAAAAADVAFGMAPPRTQVLTKLLQDVMDAIPELSKLTGKAGDCILLQSAATKVYGALVGSTQPATDLPDDLKAHGWQLRQARGGKWLAFVQPEGEEGEIHTNIPREKLDDVIGDARYLDKQLKIGA